MERTYVAVAGLRLAECGTNGAGSPSTSRPCNSTFVQITERAGLRVAESGTGRAVGSTPGPHIRTQINQMNGGERSRLHNPGLQLREMKPQTSD